AKLEHDHIVPIYQVGEDRGIPFIAMALLKGTSLEEFLRKRESANARQQPGPSLPVDQILKIGSDIAAGLAVAHEHGLIHRDIKPANAWVEPPQGEEQIGRVRILDFGLARTTTGEHNITESGAIIGTPAYMSPEQGRGEKLDGRCDLFSLGVVLYRLVTGQLPFNCTDMISTLMSVVPAQPPPPY